MPTLFRDRREAGSRLATLLDSYAGKPGVIVLGLPRGGIPVAFEVAHALGAPLDVFTVRKLGAPGHAELAIGAIASGGVCVLNEDYIAQLEIPPGSVREIRAREQRELDRRELLFRGERPPLDVHGSTVIVVDDGLATGATMRAAVAALRAQHPASIVVAVPVASQQACALLRGVADACVCAATPPYFPGVGAFYGDFTQTEDGEVRMLLDEAQRSLPEDARASALSAKIRRPEHDVVTH
jgi:predicted phosphoribosyltransferase